MTQELQVRQAVEPLSIAEVKGQVLLIQQVMKDVMVKDEHYGTIPGTNKPSLLKAGAEKLCLTFRLDPQYEIEKEYEYDKEADAKHLTVISKCILFHAPTGNRLGSGYGSCSTLESKYAYRKGERLCPTCGGAFIIKGKAEYGGGWLCFAKKGGCGAKFPDGDKSIEDQNIDRAPNKDLADLYNTILKMANKRSLVAAVLNVTAASDIFTQDLEDMKAKVAAEEPTPAAPAQEPGKGKAKKAAEGPVADPDGEAEYIAPGPEEESPGPMDDWKCAILECQNMAELNARIDEAQKVLDQAGLKWLQPYINMAKTKLSKEKAPAAAGDPEAKMKACKTANELWAMWKTVPENRRTLDLKRKFEARLTELNAVKG